MTKKTSFKYQIHKSFQERTCFKKNTPKHTLNTPIRAHVPTNSEILCDVFLVVKCFFPGLLDLRKGPIFPQAINRRQGKPRRS